VNTETGRILVVDVPTVAEVVTVTHEYGSKVAGSVSRRASSTCWPS
jgi:hypothetical protein